MAWYLNVVRATNIHASIPTPLTVAYGTDAYSLEFEVAYTDISTDQIILGNVSVTPVHAIYLTTGGRLQLTVGGTNAFFTAGGFGLNDGAFHKYRLEHDAGGAWRAYRDGTLFGSGTYTGTLTTTQPLNAIFKRSSATGSVTSANLQFKYLEAVGFGAGSAKWDANLSGGAGSILPTVSGTNNATLVAFPTDNSQWVPYSTGDSLAFSGTPPRLTAAISAIVTNSIDASFSGTLPKLTTAISADVTYGIRASFAGALPKLQASINATVSTGTDSLSFSGALPKLAASISATISAPPNSLAFAGIMPKLQVSISAVVSLPPPLVAFSGALPRLRMQAAMIIQVPEPAGDPLALKQALVNARRAEENRNNEYVPPVVIVPEWYIIQQRALGLKQVEVNRARDEE